MCGRANIHKVHRRIGEHCWKTAVGRDLRHVELKRLGCAGVASDPGEIAVEVSTAGIANRCDPMTVDLAIRFEVGGGHETEPDDADAYGRAEG